MPNFLILHMLPDKWIGNEMFFAIFSVFSFLSINGSLINPPVTCVNFHQKMPWERLYLNNCKLIYLKILNSLTKMKRKFWSLNFCLVNTKGVVYFPNHSYFWTPWLLYFLVILNTCFFELPKWKNFWTNLLVKFTFILFVGAFSMMSVSGKNINTR